MADLTNQSKIKTPKSKSAPEGHNLAEEAVKDPDAMQRGMIDVWGWVEENAKLLGALLAFVLLAAIAQVSYHSYQNHQEEKAQEAYYTVESKYSKLRDAFDRAKYAALMPKEAKDAKAESKPASGDIGKDYGTLVDDLVNVARANPKTTGGGQAAILAAETYLQYNQPEKAIEAAKIPAEAMSEKALVGNLARMLWGTALADKGDCQTAVGVWQKILDNKAVAFLHEDAALRSGLCYETLNQNDKAAEMYRRVVSGGDSGADSSPGQGGSSAASTAKGLLRALQIKAPPQKPQAAAAAAPGKQG